MLTFDYEGDGDQDVFVGNDAVANFLWRNNGDGTFTDVAIVAGLALSENGSAQATMGAARGDYDGDGRPDFYVTNFSDDYHTLYRSDGDGFFTDVSFSLDLAHGTRSSLGWGCAFVDIDNDGDLDIFAANGHVYPQIDRYDFGTAYRQRNQLYENLAGDRFLEVTDHAGPGFQVAKCSRGTAFGDYDNDGDVDIVIQNIDDTPTLLRNDTVSDGRWIKVRLVGSRRNRDAIGALVRVTVGGRQQVREVMSTAGFLGSNDPRLHFGLGIAEGVERIEVRWPDGAVDSFARFDADQLVTVHRDGGAAVATDLP